MNVSLLISTGVSIFALSQFCTPQHPWTIALAVSVVAGLAGAWTIDYRSQKAARQAGNT